MKTKENSTTQHYESLNKVLQEALDQLMSTKGVHHAVLTAESLDGSFHWSGAAGMANTDGTPMKSTTPFWIASITKIIIASTVLKLQETEMLSIDNTVSSYLPPGMLNGVHVVNGVDYGDKLTLRHLLSHGSGIPDYLEIKDTTGKTMVDRMEVGDGNPWEIKDILETVRNANQPLFAPQILTNKRYKARYSDTNYQILIAVIELVTKKSIAQVFKDLLFIPLGLLHTAHPGEETIEPSLPAATVWIGNKPYQTNHSLMRAFGDLNSTSQDLIKLMQALLSGRVFEKPDTLGLMMDSWQMLRFALSPITPSWPIEYGMGMMRFQLPRFITPFTPVPPFIGHSGAVGSWLFYCPSLDIIFSGTVGQVTAAAAPFRIMPKLAVNMERVLH
jgi:D-alanyl-D-alanine carboxypeptidase